MAKIIWKSKAERDTENKKNEELLSHNLLKRIETLEKEIALLKKSK